MRQASGKCLTQAQASGKSVALVGVVLAQGLLKQALVDLAECDGQRLLVVLVFDQRADVLQQALVKLGEVGKWPERTWNRRASSGRRSAGLRDHQGSGQCQKPLFISPDLENLSQRGEYRGLGRLLPRKFMCEKRYVFENSTIRLLTSGVSLAKA